MKSEFALIGEHEVRKDRYKMTLQVDSRVIAFIIQISYILHRDRDYPVDRPARCGGFIFFMVSKFSNPGLNDKDT